MSKARSFPRSTDQHDWVIECQCGAWSLSSAIGVWGHNPLSAIKKWRGAGWFVGNSPKHDKCPNCLKGTKMTKSFVPKPPILNITAGMGDGGTTPTPPKLEFDRLGNPVTTSQRVVSPAVFLSLAAQRYTMGEHDVDFDAVHQAAADAATAPREMEKDHRRLIFSQLDDCYLGEGSGYSKGWDDQRVADALKYPRKWVSDVREEFFGPAIAISSAAELEKELLVVMQANDDIAALINTMLGDASKFEERLQRVQEARKENFNVICGLSTKIAALTRIAGVK